MLLKPPQWQLCLSFRFGLSAKLGGDVEHHRFTKVEANFVVGPGGATSHL